MYALILWLYLCWGWPFWTSTHQSLNWADNYWQCLNIWWMNIWKIHGSTGEWSSSQNSHPFVLATERCNPYNDQSTKGLQGFWSLLTQFHPTWGWAQRTSPHLTSGREGPWIFSAMTRVLKSRGAPKSNHHGRFNTKSWCSLDMIWGSTLEMIWG